MVKKVSIEKMIDMLRYKAENIKAHIEPEFFNDVADVLEELKEYRIAFELLLKDDCLNDKDWLGTLDELYEGRKEYYLNKAKEKLKGGVVDENRFM